MTEIRQPHDWQEGDLAFCIEGHKGNSAGDIRKVVRRVHSRHTLHFGVESGHNAPGDVDKFARVLTSSQVKALPKGSGVYFVTSALTESNPVGHSFLLRPRTNVKDGHLYALKSLPEPVHMFKVGDWVQLPRGGKHQVRELDGDGSGPYSVFISDGTWRSASSLTPITEQEAQRMLALKDIEDARAKLADAEARLNFMKETS